MNHFSHSVIKNDIIVIIDFLKSGCVMSDYVPLHHSFIRDYLPWLEGQVGRSDDA